MNDPTNTDSNQPIRDYHHDDRSVEEKLEEHREAWEILANNDVAASDIGKRALAYLDGDRELPESESQNDQIFCADCGAQVASTDNFCSACGHEVND